MFYREFPPPEALQRYVRCLWYLDRHYQMHQPAEVVWPAASVEIIFHFEDRYLWPGLDRTAMPYSFVIGPLTRFVSLTSLGRVRLAGARLYPWGFARLFGGRLRELRDLVLPFDDLAPAAARRLEEQVCEAPPTYAVACLTQFLLSRLGSARTDHWMTLRLPGTLSGLRNAESLAAEANLSLRQLERQFDDFVGVSPKQLVRIVRFNRARQALLADPARSLLEVTYRCGYADYSHMTKDFRAFFGLSPAALRRRVAMTCAATRDVEFLQAVAP